MSVDAYQAIRSRALERIDGSGLDPHRDTDRLTELLRATVDDYQRSAQLGEVRSLADPEATVRRLLQSVTSYGPLGDLLDRDDVEEIFIEGDRVTYLEAGGRLRGLDTPSTETENRQVIERLMAVTDRRLDASHPVSQARILDGSARLTAVIPPVADRLSATIRRFALRRETLNSLVELGSLSAAAAGFLAAAMRASASVIVSGPPGAGKTSFLSALISAIPSDHCVRACEEVRELHVPLVHGSYYEARPPSLDGSGEISLRDLVKVTLAMRPDLIVVGEVRGAEAPRRAGNRTAVCGRAGRGIAETRCRLAPSEACMDAARTPNLSASAHLRGRRSERPRPSRRPNVHSSTITSEAVWTAPERPRVFPPGRSEAVAQHSSPPEGLSDGECVHRLQQRGQGLARATVQK